MRFKDNNHRILFGFALSYLMLLAIPLIMGIFAFVFSMNLAKDNITRSSRQTLEKCTVNLSNSLMMLDQFSVMINENNKINNALSQNLANKGERLYSSRKVIENLPFLYDNTQIIDNYYLYIVNYDLILSPRKGYLKPFEYYNNNLKTDENNYDQWFSTIQNPLLNKLIALPTSDGESSGRLMYISAYVLSSGRPLGYIVFEINVDTIRRWLEPAFENGCSFVSVLDGDGNVLLNMSREDINSNTKVPQELFDSEEEKVIKIDNEQTYLSYCCDGALQLVYAIPMKVFSEQSRDIRNTIAIGMFALIITELLIAMLIMRNNQKPLKQILLSLNSTGITCEEFHSSWGLLSVEHAVQSLSDEQHILKQTVAEQHKMMRDNYISRLVNGGLEDQTHPDLPIKGDCYRGVLLKYLPDDSCININIARAAVIDTLRNYSNELHFLGLENKSTYILLLSMEYSQLYEKEHYIALLRQLYLKLRSDDDAEICFYIGYECSSLNDIYHSFAVARRLMQQASDLNDRYLIEQTTECNNENHYIYTIMHEQKLINLSGGENIEQIQLMLDDLYNLNFKKRSLSDFMRRLLYHKMIGTLVMENRDISLPPELSETLSSYSPEKFFDLLKQQYACLISLNQEKKTKSINTLFQQICWYLQQNYQDPNLSLSSVALQFGFSECYLSLFFKDKMGENFSSYIERLRIEHANTLLNQTNNSITRIAEEIGYTNANTFRRAYRRVLGYSPMQYRQKTLSLCEQKNK